MAITKDIIAWAQASSNVVDIPFSLSVGQLGYSNKVLFVSAHSRGNAGTSELTCELRTASGGGGSLLYTLTEVADIDADNILHAHFHHLLNSDVNTLSPATTYYMHLTTPGAFQVGGGILLLDNINQTQAASPTVTSNTNAGGTSVQQSIDNTTAPGIILDNWSGDGTEFWAADIGVTRTNSGWINGGSGISLDLALQAQSAYTDVATTGSKTFGWSGVFNNRAAQCLIFYEELGGTPGTRRPNVHIFGAFA